MDDLLARIRERVAAGERVLVTTLTRLRKAAHGRKLLEKPHDPNARDRRIGEDRQTLAAEAVHEREDPKAPALFP